MLHVTVPCEKCGAPVGFGARKCARCGVGVSREAQRALHARLEASSEDYRDLQNQISSARSALLVASLMDAYSILAWVISHRPDVDAYLARRTAEEATVRENVELRSPTADLRQRLVARGKAP